MPCPGCGYNLRGVAEPVCPECGVALTVAKLDAANSYASGYSRLHLSWFVPCVVVTVVYSIGALVVLNALHTEFLGTIMFYAGMAIGTGVAPMPLAVWLRRHRRRAYVLRTIVYLIPFVGMVPCVIAFV